MTPVHSKIWKIFNSFSENTKRFGIKSAGYYFALGRASRLEERERRGLNLKRF